MAAGAGYLHQNVKRSNGNRDPKVNCLYPVTSGVISSVLAKKKVDSYRKIFVDGIEDCREVFEDMKKGLIEGRFY